MGAKPAKVQTYLKLIIYKLINYNLSMLISGQRSFKASGISDPVRKLLWKKHILAPAALRPIVI